MSLYRYETHLHTCLASACGHSTGMEHVRYYRDLGYTGIFVTDHFWGGNTSVPRDLPWKDWVDRFCSGYEDALEEGLKVGLDVFFGWEQGYGGDEYLVYGLDKQWLLDHPDVVRWNRREQYEYIHRDGGAVIQAHPFRDRAYIPFIRLNPKWVDGVEAANGGNDPINDVWAKHYADQYGFFQTAGSDNHRSQPGCTVFGVQTERKIESAQDWANMILHHEPTSLIVPPERFIPSPTDRGLVTNWTDADGNPTPTCMNWG